MNHYRKLLYLFLCLLLYNINNYVESPDTVDIPLDSSTHLKPKTPEDDEIIVIDSKSVQNDNTDIQSDNDPSRLTYEHPITDSIGVRKLNNLIPIDLDLNSHSSTKGYKCFLLENFEIYSAMNGYGFSSVKVVNPENNSEFSFWKSDNDEYGTKVKLTRYSFVQMFELSITMINGNTKKFFRDKHTNWKEVDFKKTIPVTLNVLSEYNTYAYYIKCHGFSKSFISKPGFAFSSVVELNKFTNSKTIFWETKDKKNYSNKVEYMIYKSVSLNFGTLIIYLLNGDILKHANYNIVNKNNKWVQMDSNKDIPIQINIASSEQSFFHYNYLHGPYRIMEAKKGFIFNCLYESSNPYNLVLFVWQTIRPEKYSKKIMYQEAGIFSSTSDIIICHVDGKFTHLTSVDDGWAPIDPSVILDITDKWINIAYEYSKNNNEIESFTPNGNYLFRGVLTTKEILHFRSKIEIWNVEIKKDYAKKVLIIPSSKGKYLVILLLKDRYVVFYKLYTTTTWTNQTHNPYALKQLKLLGFDFSNLKPYVKDELEKVEPESITEPEHENLIDLDINKIHNIKEYDITYGNDKMIFRAKKPYLFQIVKNNDEILWQPKNNGEYLYKVVYKVIDNQPKIKVYFPEDESKPKRKPKPMMQFNPSDLNVEVINYEIGDKNVENELSHKQNTRFSWKII